MQLVIMLWLLPITASALAGAAVRRPLHGVLTAVVGSVLALGFAILPNQENLPFLAATFWMGLALMVSGVLLTVLLAIAPGLSPLIRGLAGGGIAAVISLVVTILIENVPFS